MNEPVNPIDNLIHQLRERAKELNCLYAVQELLSTPDISIDDLCQGIIKCLPPGWQYPEVCGAQIILYEGKKYQTPLFSNSPWIQSADIRVLDQVVGKISVCYNEECPVCGEGPFLKEGDSACDEGPFLNEERKLIDTIAEQFGYYLLHQQLHQVFQEQLAEIEPKSEWEVIRDLLKRTDPELLKRITNRMVNYLYWNGVKEAEQLLKLFTPGTHEDRFDSGENRPSGQGAQSSILTISDQVFTIASQHLSRSQILENIQRWIMEDRSAFLADILVNSGSSLADISAAIERFHQLSPQGIELTAPRERSFRTSLIRHVLNDQPWFVEMAKNHIDFDDFGSFMHRLIYPTGSHGKLGGKSSGLFLAEQILKRSTSKQELLQAVKTPKTWYLTSDNIFYFMSYNNLEDFFEQKFKDIVQVKQEYPYIVNLFKNAPQPPEILKGLSLALDDFGDVPLIVRSSSLLEDRVGASFAGKYKSLFISNQGSKEERLKALMEAIAEVYASMFGPDPIEYRYENGLIDDHEEMGIMIQEVVGKQVGPYYLPSFAGVAFSNNNFRWSSRIQREDGLVRMVPGLGTRAVDRLSDDYPILVAPGKPNLPVNVSLDEIIRYSPIKIDLINLQTRTFETVEVRQLLKAYGQEYPLINQVVSILQQDRVRIPGALAVDFDKEECVVTFEGLISRTPFLKQLQDILKTLQESLGYPVDIEFAHDGINFYLLQCRVQSFREEITPAEIPQNVPEDEIIFTANRYISNGIVSDITHIVYVDPFKYNELATKQDMDLVGRVVGRLNKILPRRQFILMGPGRWGSRGDIKLGVSVTYSDINNTSMLIEIARKQHDYTPDPSFGTHFFQDLVEASIRYLPLYPDDRGIIFNEQFLTSSRNILLDILPDFASLADVIRVINVPAVTDGRVLQVLLNSDREYALARLTSPSKIVELEARKVKERIQRKVTDVHWQWRLQAAESIAASIIPEKFGVVGFYLFGSVNNATAGQESDIDLLVHFRGTQTQRQDLLSWLDGWNNCLSEINYQRTGYRISALLDVHLVTDEDIHNRTSYAIKIGAVSDAARPLTMGLRKLKSWS